MAQQRIIKRIGNDVYVEIPIYESDGAPFEQNGAVCRFEMRNGYTTSIAVKEWQLDGNRLSFWLLADEIITTGYYDLWGEVKRDEADVRDGKATHTFDVRRLLRIVDHSEQITDEAAQGIHGMLDMYALSVYHSYVRTTDDVPIMTEKEWTELVMVANKVLNIIKEFDEEKPTDYNVFSSLRTRKEIKDALAELDLSELDKKYLSKINPDEAQGIIKFIQGLITKNIISPNYMPSMLGEGFSIDEYGRAVLESLEIRTSLTVPELRFNRVSIYTGIRWDTFGGGIIESVEIDTDDLGKELQSGIITLRLEDGDIGAIDVDDMCMGIYHNFGSANDTVTEDQQNGNFRFKGFSTSYFRVTEILESDNSRFRYVLRGKSDRWQQQHHPSQFMHFAGYANPTNPDRQASSYTTPYYTIRLRNMTTWEYGQNNIYEITGKLDGFEVGGEPLQGHGTSIENMYFSGYIREIKNAPIDLVIHDSGDGFLALGESTTLTCKVTHGWNDITDNVDTWSIIRESGNQADDNVWNINHTDFNGIITLTHTKAYSDLGNGISTMFTITAKGNTESGQSFTRETIITI